MLGLNIERLALQEIKVVVHHAGRDFIHIRSSVSLAYSQPVLSKLLEESCVFSNSNAVLTILTKRFVPFKLGV